MDVGKARPGSLTSATRTGTRPEHIAAISGIARHGPGRLQRNVESRNEPHGGLGLHDHAEFQTNRHRCGRRDFEFKDGSVRRPCNSRLFERLVTVDFKLHHDLPCVEESAKTKKNGGRPRRRR
jgi:hypothetical protein